tara:strand:+ start:114 stop:725 length:612 start_codon:yes stop_codon:yes gene_type:complete
MSSEYSILCNSENVILSFASDGLLIDKFEQKFEFLNYLSSEYKNKADLYFFMDKQKEWYHKGITGISTSILETRQYLVQLIQKGNYKRIICIGYSSGGYAALLFGSILKANLIITFNAQTLLNSCNNKKYSDILPYINRKTSIILYTDSKIKRKKNYHHHSQSRRILIYKNAKVIEKPSLNVNNYLLTNEITPIINSYLNKEE